MAENAVEPQVKDVILVFEIYLSQIVGIKKLIKEGNAYEAFRELYTLLPVDSRLREKLVLYEQNNLQKLRRKNIIGLISDEEKRISFNQTAFIVLKLCSLIGNKDLKGLENFEINNEELHKVLLKIIHFEKELDKIIYEWRWTQESYKVPAPPFVYSRSGKVVPRIATVWAEGLSYLFIGAFILSCFFYSYGFSFNILFTLFILSFPHLYGFLKRLTHARNYNRAYRSHLQSLEIYNMELLKLRQKVNWEDNFYK